MDLRTFFHDLTPRQIGALTVQMNRRRLLRQREQIINVNAAQDPEKMIERIDRLLQAGRVPAGTHVNDLGDDMAQYMSKAST